MCREGFNEAAELYHYILPDAQNGQINPYYNVCKTIIFNV